MESISFEDQIFITLKTFRQNHTNLHLAQLFNCFVATIANIITTFIHVWHDILFKDIMTIPSRDKNKLSAYSSYRGMHSFKVIVGVAPNAVITYVCMLYPGSISDKAIVLESGLFKHLTPGDMILADKGFFHLAHFPSWSFSKYTTIFEQRSFH